MAADAEKLWAPKRPSESRPRRQTTNCIVRQSGRMRYECAHAAEPSGRLVSGGAEEGSGPVGLLMGERRGEAEAFCFGKGRGRLHLIIAFKARQVGRPDRCDMRG